MPSTSSRRPTRPASLADPAAVAAAGEKLFILDMFPYPSDYGLHVGHPLGFIGTDVFARYQRMAGRNVLYTMGFDAFGLPAEQFAVQTGQHPAVTTASNVVNYRKQLRRLGMSHDQRRSVETTDPALLPVDAVDLRPHLRLVVRPRRHVRRRRRRPGPADRRARRRVRGRHPADAGRAGVVVADGGRARRDHRPAAPRLRRRSAGQLVPGPRHGRRQRGGHRRRSQRSRQLPRVQAHDAPVDDAHHGVRRPPDRRPRPARLDRRPEDDAAQLDRPVDRGAHRLRLARRSDLGVHDATRHAVRRHVHGPRPRASAGAGPDDVASRPSRWSSTARRRPPSRRPSASTRTAPRPACSPVRTPPTRRPARTSRSGSPTTC